MERIIKETAVKELRAQFKTEQIKVRDTIPIKSKDSKAVSPKIKTKNSFEEFEQSDCTNTGPFAFLGARFFENVDFSSRYKSKFTKSIQERKMRSLSNQYSPALLSPDRYESKMFEIKPLELKLDKLRYKVKQRKTELYNLL